MTFWELLNNHVVALFIFCLCFGGRIAAFLRFVVVKIVDTRVLVEKSKERQLELEIKLASFEKETNVALLSKKEKKPKSKFFQEEKKYAFGYTGNEMENQEMQMVYVEREENNG